MQDSILAMNPWWEDGAVPPAVLGRPRPGYVDSMEKGLRSAGTVIVTGPRRTGKTTLVRQLIQRRLDQGAPAKRCLYLQLDHPSMPRENPILASVKAFRTEMAIPRREKLHLFLDEVQHSPDWAREVKALADLEPGFQMVATGSSASVVEPDAMRHLAGRQTKLRVWPMGFREFLEFGGKRTPLSEDYLHSALLKDYLVTGGFPRAAVEEEASLRQDYLVELFEDILFKDVASVHGVKDTARLRDLAFLLASGSGSPASVNKLSRLTGLALDTTREYISHLQSSYLFHGASFYSRSVNETTYNPKKYYLVDPGMSAALSGRERAGALAETALFEQFRRAGGGVYYWKSGPELDFFLPGRKLAVECKFKDSIAEEDVRGMVAFLSKYGLKQGLVATAGAEGEIGVSGKRIRLVPLWRLLLEPEGPGRRPAGPRGDVS